MASVTQFLKGLDSQMLMMQKTDENLIARLKESEKEKAEIERRYQMNKEYQKKLSLIKKEEKRHIAAAKQVPKFYEHQYEMDRRSAEFINQAIDDLKSVESSPERQDMAKGFDQSAIDVVLEDADE